MGFTDRAQAGERLAERLEALGLVDPVVLAIPRGGVVVAAVVAKRLGAALDLALARKIGAPFNEELAIGAVGEDGSVVLSQGMVRRLDVTDTYIEDAVAHARSEIERRRREYMGDRAPLDVTGRTVVIVDDGIATGATAEVAARAAVARGPASVVVAAPVASPEAVRRLEGVADRVVVLEAPAFFSAVGQFYDRFEQLTDDEVRLTLDPWIRGT